VAEGEGGFENGGRSLLDGCCLLFSVCELNQEEGKESAPVFSEVANHSSAPAEKSLKTRSLHLVDNEDNEVDARQVVPGDVVDIPRAPLGQVPLRVQTLADVVV